jgi:hypothetical protein
MTKNGSRSAKRDSKERVSSGRSGKDKSGEISLGSILGSATGEGDRDVVPGGWSGTEDATSTAPSDLMGISLSPDGQDPVPDINKMGDDVSGFSDLLETDEPEENAAPEVSERPHKKARAG